MAITTDTATGLLKKVHAKLAEASRAREHTDLTTAKRGLETARAMFDDCRYGLVDMPPALRLLFQSTEAEMLLVDAMVSAHEYDLPKSNANFAKALEAASHEGLPSYMRARVLCCWGAVLLSHGDVHTAIMRLESALYIFKKVYREEDRGFANEVAQTAYHLARAYRAYKKYPRRARLREAIACLEAVIPRANAMGIPSPYTTKYQLAAIILLATLRWRNRERQEARRLYEDAVDRGFGDCTLLVVAPSGARTIENIRLRSIARYGFCGHIIAEGIQRHRNKAHLPPEI